MAENFDVLVLGTGNAGMAAAGVARAAGKSVVMVEKRDVGGTCPLRGCVPKKVLVAAAQVLHQISIASIHHIEVGTPRLDWGKLVERERTFVEGVPDEFRKSLENRGIQLIEGDAFFTGRNRVEADGGEIEGKKILIATGSTPRPLPLPGRDSMIDSDDILELTTLPESLVFIGGGVIALEFSHVFARAGTKVTILEVMERLLPRMEAGAVAQIHKESERLSIDIQVNVEVAGMEQVEGGITVSYGHGGEEKTVTASLVANGAGRIPDVVSLDLDAGGIDHQGSRIEVDEYLRSTSNPDVYVAGDALWSSPQLSPVASHEGRIVGRNMVEGDKVKPDYVGLPANVYTVPALATVGLTEDEAREKKLKFAVKENEMDTWRSARTHAETVAYAKVLVEDETDKILGAHMVGHGAEEVIHSFAFAIRHGITAGELGDTIYAYPTFTSDIKFLV